MADIIIIDDEEPVRRAVRRILERAGHRILEAADGSEGLRLLGESGADLVVTDIFMPGKDGMETIQELKENFPDIPILAISGGAPYDPRGALVDAELFGANEVLAKPFSVEELQAAVERILP